MTDRSSDNISNTYLDWGRRLRASDRAAFAELFEEMHRPLIRYALKLTNDEASAYDVVQDAFVKLWSIRERIDPKKSLRALMYTVVRNRALNQLRLVQGRQERLQAMSNELEPSVASTTDARIDAELLGAKIREWIQELPPKRREAFQLSRFDGLTHEEIAEVMQITPRTVTNHIMTALQYVRGRMLAFEAGGAP